MSVTSWLSVSANCGCGRHQAKSNCSWHRSVNKLSRSWTHAHRRCQNSTLLLHCQTCRFKYNVCQYISAIRFNHMTITCQAELWAETACGLLCAAKTFPSHVTVSHVKCTLIQLCHRMPLSLHTRNRKRAENWMARWKSLQWY